MPEVTQPTTEEATQAARLADRFRLWTERGGRVHLEPSERRVGAILGGTTVADSRRVQLLFLPPPFNSYAFPRDDVRLDLMNEVGEVVSMPGLGDVKRWTVSAGGKVAANAAWTFPKAPEGL